MRKLLFALLAVIVLLIAADRVADAVAERKVSDRVAGGYGLPAKPGVRIAGFPFLTQVLAGSYPAVHIDVPGVLAGGVRYSATVQPRASAAGSTLTPRQVQVGRTDRGPARTLAGRLRFTVPLGALPLHLQLSSVRVSPAGLHISATGRDVHFATGG
jgi:LmeA-like phospholipid-binding